MKKLILCLFFMGLLTGEGVASERKVVYGYVEKVTLVGKDVTLSAKLDTGAKTASLSAIRIKEVHENGKLYLTFTVPTKTGEFRCKAEYVGKVNIKPRMGEYLKEFTFRTLKRPIVRMRLRLGSVERDILLNLTNRKRFNYPLLLGRDALVAFDGLVDPSHVFLLKKGLEVKVSESHDKT